MGLVSTLLLGPVKVVTWTADQILQAAEQQRFDQRAILAALADLNDRYDRGLIVEAEFEAAEDELMERLETAREMGTERP